MKTFKAYLKEGGELSMSVGKAQADEFETNYKDGGVSFVKNGDITRKGNKLVGNKAGFKGIGEYIAGDYAPESQGGLGDHIRPSLRRSMRKLGHRMLRLAKNADV